jgi:VanZ family protein
MSIAKARVQSLSGRVRILGGLLILLTMALLVLGLWPFHSPKNQAGWIANGNGLRLGKRSTVLSSNPLSVADSQGQFGCSLELWLVPNRGDDTGTILAFYDAGTGSLFAIRQQLTDLVLEQERLGGVLPKKAQKVYVDELLQAKKAIFLTVASSAGGTAIYADGELVKRIPGFRFSTKDVARRLIVGDSPGQSDGWSGQFRGLAIYSQDLTVAQVRRHHAAWMQAGTPEANGIEGFAALYTFSEHAGAIAHGTDSTGVELYIPARYSIVDKTILEAPWNAFEPTWNYWQDVAINIGGFVPLGLLAAMYYSAVRGGPVGNSRGKLAAIVLGGAISLTIEGLQVFLPTRDSDMTDVMTNTLGTCIGAAMLGWEPARRAVDGVLGGIEFMARQVGITFTN